MERRLSHRRAIIIVMIMPDGLSVERPGSSSTAAPLEEHFTRLDGHAIHYLSVGSGKLTLVFLSGWGCDMSLWRHQVPALAPYSRLLLVDLPGHGRSDKPDIPYTMALFARAVDAVLEDAGVEKAAIAGHSMGAMVAYQFAREHPDKATAIIFVEGAFGIPVEVEKQIAGFRSRAQDLRLPDYQEKLLAFVDQLFIPETPAAVREEVRQSILATPSTCWRAPLRTLPSRNFLPQMFWMFPRSRCSARSGTPNATLTFSKSTCHASNTKCWRARDTTRCSKSPTKRTPRYCGSSVKSSAIAVEKRFWASQAALPTAAASQIVSALT